MNAAIRLLQGEISDLRQYLADCPSTQGAEEAQQSIVELGDALDLLRGAVAP